MLIKAKEVITEHINRTCVQILEDTAVFKKSERGMLSFKKFLNVLEIK